jgi:hypothetical protein
MSNIKGNRAVKVPNEQLDQNLQDSLLNMESYIYFNILSGCEGELAKLSQFKNIDILEHQSLFEQRCAKFEKLFLNSLRTNMRERMFQDQIKEFTGNYEGIYHPYNPYLQKYNGAYLRTYQQF